MGDLMAAVDARLADIDSLLGAFVGGASVADGLRAAVLAHREALQARIADLEAELTKPVAKPWTNLAPDRGFRELPKPDAPGEDPRIIAGWGLAIGGWFVRGPDGLVVDKGPETGPEAERLADAAAAPFWRLT